MSTNLPNDHRITLGRPKELAHTLVTPEGIALPFVLAPGGDRLGAFILDWVITKVFILLIIYLLHLVTPEEAGSGWIVTVLLILAFFAEQAYFIWFEVRSRGMTPGKRRAGLRVVSQHAGPITPDAIIARNLTRVLEVQFPLMVLLAPDQFWPGAPGWSQLLAMVWIFLFAGMPLFNKRRLRIGDMIAGTMVIVTPRTLLLPDVGGKSQERSEREGQQFAFKPEQLTVYGIYELQVLEDLLRQQGSGATRDAKVAVARKISRKIGYAQTVPRAQVSRFLTEFYAAMRAHQEHRMLFGRTKRDKHSDEEAG